MLTYPCAHLFKLWMEKGVEFFKFSTPFVSMDLLICMKSVLSRLWIYIEHQKRLITSLEQHTLKYVASKFITTHLEMQTSCNTSCYAHLKWQKVAWCQKRENEMKSKRVLQYHRNCSVHGLTVPHTWIGSSVITQLTIEIAWVAIECSE